MSELENPPSAPAGAAPEKQAGPTPDPVNFDTMETEDAALLLGPGGQQLTVQVVRTLFVVICASLGWEQARTITEVQEWYFPRNLLGLAIGLSFGLSMVVLEVKSSKRFAANIFTIALGIFLGFIGSHLLYQGLTMIPHLTLIDERWREVLRLFLTLVFCYLAIVALFQGKDQFKLVIPFVETEGFGRQSPWLLDTSVIVDGRIEKVLIALKVEAPIVVPAFVLHELQLLADSRDKLKRERGRRGLDMLASLKSARPLQVDVDEMPVTEGIDVDSALIGLARRRGARVVSNDNAVRKISEIHGVECINLHELADALKLVVMPGEAIQVNLVRPGEQPEQGLGYLADGTMVVVDRARPMIGQTIPTVVTSILQTQTGRIIFAKPAG